MSFFQYRHAREVGPTEALGESLLIQSKSGSRTSNTPTLRVEMGAVGLLDPPENSANGG